MWKDSVDMTVQKKKQIGAITMTKKGNTALQSHGAGYLHNQSFEDCLSMENYSKELTHREGPLISNKLQ